MSYELLGLATKQFLMNSNHLSKRTLRLLEAPMKCYFAFAVNPSTNSRMTLALLSP
jgi:hypothetical protein